MAPSRGKAQLGSRGQGGVGKRGRELRGVRWYLLKLILEVTEYGIEDSVSGLLVIIIKVVVFSCLSMYVEALYGVKVDEGFLEL